MGDDIPTPPLSEDDLLVGVQLDFRLTERFKEAKSDLEHISKDYTRLVAELHRTIRKLNKENAHLKEQIDRIPRI